jgi:hypothetical protein
MFYFIELGGGCFIILYDLVSNQNVPEEMSISYNNKEEVISLASK